MRGSPLFRAVLTLVALLLVAWPVWRITHARAKPSAATPLTPELRTATAARPRLALEFLPSPPLDFEVKYLGKSIWRGGGEISRSSPPLEISAPAEGVDLQVSAHWPAGLKNAAVRIRLTLPDGGTMERVAWTRDAPSLDEVLTFADR